MSKSKLIDAARTKDSRTANMALTHSTSLYNCVDMFFLAGASREMYEDDIITLFERAKGEDRSLALKILFWARDCRGGAGERRFFRVIWKHLFETDIDAFMQHYKFVPEYGRWDDLFYNDAFLTEVHSYLKRNLLEAEDGLLAKWLPRKGVTAAKLRRLFNMSPKEYRKTIVELSDTVEQKMCAKEWSQINYSHVPSVAMNKYRKAFLRNDESRFRSFLNRVEEGDDKINADVLFPHQLYSAYIEGEDYQAIRAQWNALPNFMEDVEGSKILPVCDVSGSMTSNKGLPMSVSVSLGCYISERNEGIFKDAFVTFSGSPKMQYLQGDDIISRFHQLKEADWEMNTNLQATFELLLERALEEDIPSSDMPDTLLIISDMEFDRAVGRSGWGATPEPTNLEAIRDKYARSGYPMPTVVFWNVNGRLDNVPATFNEDGIGLVSGFSPSILKGILAGDILNPEALMLTVVETERYERIGK